MFVCSKLVRVLLFLFPIKLKLIPSWPLRDSINDSNLPELKDHRLSISFFSHKVPLSLFVLSPYKIQVSTLMPPKPPGPPYLIKNPFKFPS